MLWYRTESGFDVHVLIRGRGKYKRMIRFCVVCGFVSDYLCDFPMFHGRTCDAPLCKVCAAYGAIKRANIQGKENDLLCYCPVHFNRYLGPHR